jgi:hypothetical protein
MGGSAGAADAGAVANMMKNAREAGFLPQMTAAEFAAALKANGFRAVRAKIEDATGQCPGVRWPAVFRRKRVDYNRTLAKVLQERDAEIARRTGRPSP